MFKLGALAVALSATGAAAQDETMKVDGMLFL